MKKHFLLLCVILAVPAFAIEGIYVGGELGHVGLAGESGRTYTNAIGFGLDLGVKTNPLLDVVFHLQTSSHAGGGGGLNLYSQSLSANLHFWEVEDFEFTVGIGPGFYFFKRPLVTTSNFGINIGLAADVKVDDNLRVGLGTRWHGVFGKDADSYLTVMMQLGYWFNLGS